METNEAIRTKRAVREFSTRSLPDSIVLQMLTAGRRAQSSKNSQPWHFVAIRDRTILEALSQLGTYAGHLAGAALGVAILTPDPDQRWSIMFDAGQAAAYMQLAAWDLGVASCLATIYETDQARSLLGFPDEFHLRAMISFGYPQDPAVLTAKSARGGRRLAEQVFHFERW